MRADEASPQSSQAVNSAEKQIHFTIGDVELSCAGAVIGDPVERRIAWFLMLYGDWDIRQEAKLDDKGPIGAR